MKQKQPKPPNIGFSLLQKITTDGIRVFSIRDIVPYLKELKISNSYIYQILHHLKKSGWIIQLKSGLYAVGMPFQGGMPLHEFEIAMHLAQPAAISHLAAFSYHRLTEQIPSTVSILTHTRVSLPRKRSGKPYGEVVIQGVTYRFIQINPKLFFGIEKIWIGQSLVHITDLERTLIDGITSPQYVGGFAEVMHAFSVSKERFSLDRIIEYAHRFPAVCTKRLGWILEHIGIPANSLEPLKKIPISGYRFLNPEGPKHGSCNKDWFLIENFTP